MIAICEKCSKEYKTVPSWYAKSVHHYCSRVCFMKASKEVRSKRFAKAGEKTRFKPGDKPSANRKMPKAERHHAWKGEKVGYRGLHYWLRRVKGIPKVCEHCSTTDRLQWANIDGEYRRDPDDFIALCASCHKIYDLSTNTNEGF